MKGKTKTSTAAVMDQQASKATEYTIGEATKKHIAEFAAGLVASGQVGKKCVKEALTVAGDFPKWDKDNRESVAAFKALGKAVREQLIADKFAEASAQVYGVHFCNIVKVAQLDMVKVQTGKTKAGKPKFSEVKPAKYFGSMASFTDAYHAAQKAIKVNGLTNRTPRSASDPKPLDKAQLVDLLDKCIAGVRLNAELAEQSPEALSLLTKVKAVITGTKLGKLKDANRQASISAGLRAHKAGLSRGQKAAATRRANLIKAKRVAENARIVH